MSAVLSEGQTLQTPFDDNAEDRTAICTTRANRVSRRTVEQASAAVLHTHHFELGWNGSVLCDCV